MPLPIACSSNTTLAERPAGQQVQQLHGKSQGPHQTLEVDLLLGRSQLVQVPHSMAHSGHVVATICGTQHQLLLGMGYLQQAHNNDRLT